VEVKYDNVYIPIGNYWLSDFIAAKDDYFAVLAYPRPGSIDTTAKYVIYDRSKNRKSLLGGKNEIFANGIGPTFANDIFDFSKKSVAFIAHSGQGKFILDVERTLYVHSWWSADKLEVHALRHDARLTFVNNTVRSEFLTITAFNGPFNASVELDIRGGGFGKDSSSKWWLYVLGGVGGIAVVGLMVFLVMKFMKGREGSDDEKETSMQHQR
jgi:hypothetical protein